jgi:hypothetical protein
MKYIAERAKEKTNAQHYAHGPELLGTFDLILNIVTEKHIFINYNLQSDGITINKI